MTMKIDPHSQTWLNIRAYVEGRMETIRTQLESNIAFDETLQLRAKLQELKAFIGETQVEVPLLQIEDYDIPG
jgi:hypothetical protein